MTDARVALVTGATRGIGKAIAEALAHQGMTVIGTATTDTGATTIDSHLKQLGNGGAGIRLDVTDGPAVEAAIADIQKRFGEGDVLVNNPGLTRANLPLPLKDDP